MKITENDFKQIYKLEKFAERSIKKFNLKFPMYPNENLAKIVSFLTFDGHLRKDLKMFEFTSGNRFLLYEPKKLIENEFGIRGVFRKITKHNYGTSYSYRISNRPFSRILYLFGTPVGNKVLVPFSVPPWISNNKDFSKVYLQTAFDCEGSAWKEGRSIKIRFRIHKAKNLIKNGIRFLEEIKSMLSNFDIKTSKIWMGHGNYRKDGIETKYLCFNIINEDIPVFKKEIGFGLKNKNEILMGL